MAFCMSDVLADCRKFMVSTTFLCKLWVLQLCSEVQVNYMYSDVITDMWLVSCRARPAPWHNAGMPPRGSGNGLISLSSRVDQRLWLRVNHIYQQKDVQKRRWRYYNYMIVKFDHQISVWIYSATRGGWKCGLSCHVTILTGAWLVIVKYCKSTISISLWYQELSSQA